MSKLGIDSLERIPYKIGYSFRNPAVVAAATKYRKPFWEMNYATQGPTQVKAAFWKSKKLNRFPSVWRRAAKLNAVSGLGDIEERGELPDFYELGQAPGPTAGSVTGSTERSPWGQLLNTVLTGVNTVFTEQHKLQMAKSGQLIDPSRFTIPTGLYSQEEGIGTWGWGVIALGGGLLTYFLIKKL